MIPPENSDFVSDDNLFNYQAKVIKRAGSAGILRDYRPVCGLFTRDDPDVIKLYFCAPKKDCVARVMNQNGPLGEGKRRDGLRKSTSTARNITAIIPEETGMTPEIIISVWTRRP